MSISHDYTSVATDELGHEILDETLDEPQPASDHVKFSDEDHNDVAEISNDNRGYYQDEQEYYAPDSHHSQQYFRSQRSSPFHYNKRQTGKKNVSSIIIGSDNKIEFNQVDGKGFVKINRPTGVPMSARPHEHSNDTDSMHSRDSEHTRTAEGFFDLKFYSHPLW